MIARRPGPIMAPSRELARFPMEPHDVARSSLAQSHAFHLARTLMVPVTLFRSAGEYGVLPSEELDDADVDVIHEIDPFDFGPAH